MRLQVVAALTDNTVRVWDLAALGDGRLTDEERAAKCLILHTHTSHVRCNLLHASRSRLLLTLIAPAGLPHHLLVCFWLSMQLGDRAGTKAPLRDREAATATLTVAK